MAERQPDTQFIERMGVAAEQDRLPRIAGRILGLLLLEEGPLSLDEVAKRLQVSRASVSTNARLLQSLGVIERVSLPGDRRDHFEIAPEPGQEMLRNTARQLHERSRMLGKARQSLDDRPIAKQRLESLERFYRAVGRGIERAILELDHASSD